MLVRWMMSLKGNLFGAHGGVDRLHDDQEAADQLDQ